MVQANQPAIFAFVGSAHFWVLQVSEVHCQSWTAEFKL
ncbi:MAG: hypothetical protein RJA36_2143 [Pseudomonadota bacterium]|jgi:hypothetical protein